MTLASGIGQIFLTRVSDSEQVYVDIKAAKLLIAALKTTGIENVTVLMEQSSLENVLPLTENKCIADISMQFRHKIFAINILHRS